MDKIENEVKDQLDAMKDPYEVEKLDISSLKAQRIVCDLKSLAMQFEIQERRA